MFLTPEQTGGPLIFALRQHNRYLTLGYLALEGGLDGKIRAFDIRQLAASLAAVSQAGVGQGAGETWQEHASLIKLACMDGRLFEWLNSEGE